MGRRGTYLGGSTIIRFREVGTSTPARRKGLVDYWVEDAKDLDTDATRDLRLRGTKRYRGETDREKEAREWFERKKKRKRQTHLRNLQLKNRFRIDRGKAFKTFCDDMRDHEHEERSFETEKRRADSSNDKS